MGRDSAAISSLYISTDSRISTETEILTDFACKTYASQRTPTIFGFCGKIKFANIVIPQLVRKIDSKADEFNSLSCEDRTTFVLKELMSYFEMYKKGDIYPLRIVFGSRFGVKRKAQYRFVSFVINNGRLTAVNHNFLEASGIVLSAGSGEDSIEEWRLSYNFADSRGTSRAVFQAFCDSISSGQDSRTGGSPQTVGIYTQGYAFRVGIIWNGKRFVSGQEINNEDDFRLYEWRNKYFEIVDGLSMNRKINAQIHPKQKIDNLFRTKSDPLSDNESVANA